VRFQRNDRRPRVQQVSCLAKPVVLIVEDEFILRLHAVTLIQEAGFETVEASSAEEAIVLLETRLDIRIVFTDINLPGMDGLKLAAAIRDRWPPIELVLTSGQILLKPEDLPVRGFFLSKPYDGNDLVRTLRSFGA
jgi:two-component system, response regulator PdtaR